MSYFITLGDFQKELTDFYKRTNITIQFPQLMQMLNDKDMLLDHLPTPDYAMDIDTLSYEDFDNLVNLTPLEWDHALDIPEAVVEEHHMIPNERDFFIFRQLCYTRPELHTHDYFEIDFVERGEVTFYFEEQTMKMHAGEIFIIAPHSRHDISVTDENTRHYCISVRSSTFNAVFFSILSSQDLMAEFFRNTLSGETNKPNYLKFYVDKTQPFSRLIRHIFVECHTPDIYANNSGISYIYLFLSQILRYYSQTAMHYSYIEGSSPLLVLQYIQSNYRNISLEFLSEFFHYSESYLCKMIHQSTGKTYTQLVRQIRMRHAVDYLLKTDMKLADIAELIGYNSADHFSRVFRAYFEMSPQTFRKAYQKTDGGIVPALEELLSPYSFS